MIVDTSALVAVVLGESGWEQLRQVLVTSRCIIPAPVLTELQLAVAKRGPDIAEGAATLVERLSMLGAEIVSFEHRHAVITAVARERFGKGNGRGGLLNFGDLMVYAVAKSRREALLCTGRDFASTDLELHPASRLDA